MGDNGMSDGQPFSAGDILCSITIRYVSEDDDAINVDVHINVNERCDPAEYATIFRQSMLGLVRKFKETERRLIARTIADTN